MTDTRQPSARGRERCVECGHFICPDEDDAELEETRAARDAATAEAERLRAEKDGAYYERNRLVALLATLFPSGTKRTSIEGWDPEWDGCVYVDLPTDPPSQVSWHFHDSQAHLFEHLPPYAGEWDGHTTDEKYERIARAALTPAPSKDDTP
jgi:hypothetical protein